MYSYYNMNKQNNLVHHRKSHPHLNDTFISTTKTLSLQMNSITLTSTCWNDAKLSATQPTNTMFGKISAQPHTIVKQICFPNGNVLFLSLFSLSKNWMHNVVWGCAEILSTTGPDHYKNEKEICVATCKLVYKWKFTFR